MTHSFKSKQNFVFFIAEIGGNHEGDFEYAKLLVDLAVESGADAVKFQFYTGDSIVNEFIDPERNKHFWNFTLPVEKNLELLNAVRTRSCKAMASLWDIETVDVYEPFLPIHKIGSGDLTHFQMIKRLTQSKKPLILSTGISDLATISKTLEFIESCDPTYISEQKIALLHCVSNYPTNDWEANLNGMITLKNEFGLPVGYSDHTIGSQAIEIAVAMGAEIIEKHFTDTRENKSFRDHSVSLTKNETIQTLHMIRKIITLKGNNEKNITQSEIDAKHDVSFRRSLFAKHNIKKGTVVSENDVIALRPNVGLSAEHFYDLIGSRLNRHIKKLEPFLGEDIV